MTDPIECDIVIHTTPTCLFALIREPGWFIGGGDRSGQTRSRVGDLDVLDDPRYGRFAFRTEVHEPPHRVASRCGHAPLGQPVKDPRDGVTTLIEFVVAPHPDGALLRVIESGIDAFLPDEAARATFIEGNTAAWKKQLEIAKELAEKSAG